MRSVPGKRHDFKKPAPGEPWFTAPLARFIEMIDPFAIGIRTLPDDMLARELDQLTALCGRPDHHLAHRLLHRIFDAERARRADPMLLYDADLDAALSRLVRQTTEADRKLVREIGQKLFGLGGIRALQDAQRRALAAVEPDQRPLRQRFIEKRWAGIGGGAINAR